MRTLINIENFGRRNTQSFEKRFNAKIYGERRAYAPRKNVSTVPINNCEQIDETVQQSNVCDIGAPDLIGIFDVFPSEKVGKHLMTRSGFAQISLRVNCLQAKLVHNCADLVAPYVKSRHLEIVSYSARSEKWVISIDSVNFVHQ